MKPEILVFMIPLSAIIGYFVLQIVKAKQNTLSEQHSKAQLQQEQKWQQELNQLKERIIVLEQIVTDDGYHIKKEINKL